LMTTSENKRGPGRATLIALIILAAALALLPALRSAVASQTHEGAAEDCAHDIWTETCR